jgi:Carboxypeptidase regulatory-like domain
MMMRAVAVLFAAFLAAQPSSLTTIRGRVVAAATGDPIRNARVSVSTDRYVPPVLTDTAGRFTLVDVPGRKLSLTASKPGFAKASVDVSRDATEVVVALHKGAAISGLLVDDTGEPIAFASVMVERADDDGVMPRMTVVQSDDAGRYRVGGLAEGRVLVSTLLAARAAIMLPDGNLISNGPGGPQRRYYFPGGIKADKGEPLALAAGDEKLAVDLVVPASVPDGPKVTPPEKGTTVIGGRILAPDGRALRGAQVALRQRDGTRPLARQTVSDADGNYQFVFRSDIAGAFAVSAFRTGYLPAAYGQRAPADPAEEITVATGQTYPNIDVTMNPPGVVSGRIFDENGDAVEGASVRAMRLVFSDGRRRLTQAGRPAQLTDDLGQYRISGLPPGRYMVGAMVGQILMTESSADLPGYADTYYPGTPSAVEGQFVTVGRSQDVAGVDFSLARARTARVAGQALEASGDPITGGLALYPSRRSGSLADLQLGARIDRDGRFEFLNVPPGDYVLQASRHRNGNWNEGESTSMFVTVDGADVTGLDVRTTQGSTITGRIVVDEGATLRPGDIDLSPIPSDSDLTSMVGGGPAHALINEDLRFEIAGLHGPRRLRAMRLPSGWALKTIRLNGSDITDALLPFGRENQSLTDVEVVLTSHGTEIAGTIVDARNRPAAEAAVVAFAGDRTMWYRASRFVGYAFATRDGRFAIRGLAPGEYCVAVVDRRQTADLPAEIGNAELLESLVVGAQRMTLDDGQRVQVALRSSGR